MRILVADDHALFREGLVLQIQQMDETAEVEEAADLDTALEQVRGGAPLDLVLVDLAMPGTPWRDVLPAMREAAPDLPLVVLSASEERRDIEDALKLGAAGYIPKSSSTKVMLKALNLVLDGGVYLPPEILNEYRAAAPTEGAAAAEGPGLTPRQTDVLRLMGKGLSNKEIAHELNVSEGTVKLHVTAILRALGVGNRTHAVIAATERGVLS